MKPLLNCWEYRQCHRQPGGTKAISAGVCPAATDTTFDGMNRGKNAGRICWAVRGTLCDCNVSGNYSEKREKCMNCTFFRRVQAEEATANLKTKFVHFIPLNRENPLLTNQNVVSVKKGERFIHQGSKGDCAYIIRRGSCLLLINRDDEWIPVGHRGEGDFIDMMALLTGEPRSATAEAESDMELLPVTPAQLNHIAGSDPDLLTYLTEIVADRFDSKRPIAQRSIGKYVATDIIGRGGYSIVYKGRHEIQKQPVAIKMLQHHLAMEPDFLDTFRKEADIIATLDHPNIIRVYDIEEQFRTVFIIMEFLEGESLKEKCSRSGSIPFDEAEAILFQILDGLMYAHRAGIIHRDINPANIHILSDQHIKILDFGLACPIGTENTDTIGTLYYAAPEQIEGDVADERTDIYALGLTAYEIATGRLPYAEVGINRQIEHRLKEEIPDPSLECPDIPENLRRFIIKACRRDPEERYRNTDEAMIDLIAVKKNIKPSMMREKIYTQPLTQKNETDALSQSIVYASEATDSMAPAAPEPMYQENAYGISLPGMNHHQNDDCYVIRHLPDGSMLSAVADGMGGVPGGCRASAITCRRLNAVTEFPVGLSADWLVAVLQDVDHEIHEFAAQNVYYRDMGTTATVVALSGNKAYWAHVGDSRLYLFRGQRLIQISRDQNMIQFLVEEGDVLPEKAATHPARHLLEQCLGMGDCMPQGGEFEIVPEDRLLLTTDGLHDTLACSQICYSLAAAKMLKDIPSALANQAVKAGAVDDISVVVIRI